MGKTAMRYPDYKITYLEPFSIDLPRQPALGHGQGMNREPLERQRNEPPGTIIPFTAAPDNYHSLPAGRGPRMA